MRKSQLVQQKRKSPPPRAGEDVFVYATNEAYSSAISSSPTGSLKRKYLQAKLRYSKTSIHPMFLSFFFVFFFVKSGEMSPPEIDAAAGRVTLQSHSFSFEFTSLDGNTKELLLK